MAEQHATLIPTDSEIWRPVVGWETYYEVSTCGRVRRVAPGQGAVANRILNPMKTDKGYRTVRLHRINARPLTIGVHRLVALAFLIPDDSRQQVNHKSGDPSDNRIENLEWCTPGENLSHSYRELGRKLPIGNTRAAKLTPDDVREIRTARNRGEYLKDIAARYGVSDGAISHICTRKNWAHVH